MLLCQPYILILVVHLNTVLLVAAGSNIGQIFYCTRTDGSFFFSNKNAPLQVLTSKVILSMSDEEVLDMDYFMNKELDDVF